MDVNNPGAGDRARRASRGPPCRRLRLAGCNCGHAARTCRRTRCAGGTCAGCNQGRLVHQGDGNRWVCSERLAIEEDGRWSWPGGQGAGAQERAGGGNAPDRPPGEANRKAPVRCGRAPAAWERPEWGFRDCPNTSAPEHGMGRPSGALPGSVELVPSSPLRSYRARLSCEFRCSVT